MTGLDFDDWGTIIHQRIGLFGIQVFATQEGALCKILPGRQFDQNHAFSAITGGSGL
jgi:hypothetical protein